MAQQIKKTNSQGGNVIGGMGKSAATSIGNSGLDFYLTVGKFSYDWMAEKQPGKVLGKYILEFMIHMTMIK